MRRLIEEYGVKRLVGFTVGVAVVGFILILFICHLNDAGVFDQVVDPISEPVGIKGRFSQDRKFFMSHSYVGPETFGAGKIQSDSFSYSVVVEYTLIVDGPFYKYSPSTGKYEFKGISFQMKGASVYVQSDDGQVRVVDGRGRLVCSWGGVDRTILVK